MVDAWLASLDEYLTRAPDLGPAARKPALARKLEDWELMRQVVCAIVGEAPSEERRLDLLVELRRRLDRSQWFADRWHEYSRAVRGEGPLGPGRVLSEDQLDALRTVTG